MGNILINKLIMEITIKSPTTMLKIILILLAVSIKSSTTAKDDKIEGPIIGIDLGTT